MKKVKLAIISTYPFKWSGISLYTKDLLFQFKSKNSFSKIQVFTIYHKTAKNKVQSHINFLNVKHLIKFSKIINENYDLLNIHWDATLFYEQSLNYGSYLNFYSFLKIIKKPVVITMHDSFPKGRNFMRILREITKLENVSFITHYKSQQSYINILSSSLHKAFLVPHGYPANITSLSTKEKMEYKHLKNKYKGYTLVVTLGYFGPWKNQLNTIKVIPKILSLGVPIKFLFIGSSVYEKKYYLECKKAVIKNNLSSKVILEDKYLSRKKYKLYLKLADIYLAYYSTWRENTSGTIAYALAAGKPIISSRTSFTTSPEIAKLLVNVHNESEFITTIFKLAKYPVIRKQYSIKSLKASKEWVWTKTSIKYLNIFSRAIKENTSHLSEGSTIPIFVMPKDKAKKLNEANRVNFITIPQIKLMEYVKQKPRVLSILRNFLISCQLNLFFYIYKNPHSRLTSCLFK